jgi:hypothetical protein
MRREINKDRCRGRKNGAELLTKKGKREGKR